MRSTSPALASALVQPSRWLSAWLRVTSTAVIAGVTGAMFAMGWAYGGTWHIVAAVTMVMSVAATLIGVRHVLFVNAHEQQFRRLVEGTPVVLYIASLDEFLSTTYVSPQVVELTGYGPQQWYDNPELFFDIVHPDDLEAVQRTVARINQGQSVHYEYRIICADGTVRWFHDQCTPYHDTYSNQSSVRGCMIDITALKDAERALEEAEIQYRQLVQDLPVAMYIDRVDSSGSNLFMSPKIFEVLGYTAEELMAQPMLFMDNVHPDDRADADEQIAAALRGESGAVEYRVRRVDGRYAWILDECVPQVDDTGEVSAIHGFLVDVTEVKQAQLDLLEAEEQLRQSQKLEAIGRIAGGVAHDFNNLLTVIGGNTDLALDEPGLPADAVEYLGDVRAAADRAAALTRQLLAFSRKQVLQPIVLQPAEVVRDVTDMMARTIGEDIAVEVHVDDGVHRVAVDRSQLEQVLLNLIVNARDAIDGPGRIIVDVRNVDEVGVGGLPGEAVLIAVTDSGTGIPKELRQHVFEPFFTTKEKGLGTGLGLSTVLGIVEQSGGTVTIAEAPDSALSGARFEVRLPAVFDPLHVGTPIKPVLQRRFGTVLVVEDERAVRQFAERTLRRAGYRVLSADGAASALEVFSHHRDAVDVVLTDVVMPNGSGREVAEAVRGIRPDVRIVYMSGYTDDEIVRRGVATDDGHLLGKPFTGDELLVRIGAALSVTPVGEPSPDGCSSPAEAVLRARP